MKAYKYQQKVAQYLFEGKNVILQAPTGAGKTQAAMLPFLNSLERKIPFPKKCIYAVPMRVLANQFVDKYQEAVKHAGRDDRLSVTIQTGENSRDAEFEGTVIFATIDQTLSSFLISPYSLSKRKANLNAGAVAGAYLVFDEFHLFDPNSTLPTTLHMLKLLKGVVPFLLMTATFSQNMLDALAHELDAVVVGNSAADRAEFAHLPSQNKQRFYHTVDAAMSAESILSLHQTRSLVICNTVERARQIFEELRDADSGAELILLHSQLLPEDRKQREASIRTHFGQGATGGNYIVVSTQAIEVGVDMSSSALHTELAPANAIIQRAGRCARYQGEIGHVYIYLQAVKKGELVDLREEYMPYDKQEAVIARTWDAFSARTGCELSFNDEQEIISQAHGEEDERTVQNLQETSRSHRNDMFAVMRGDTGADARALIRNVIAQPITIHSNPKEVAQDPFSYPSFSLHPGTAQGLIEQWLASENYSSEWQIAIIKENERDFESQSQGNEERYYAEPVTDKKSGWMARLLVVHPSLATYDPELGLITEKRDGDVNWQAERAEKKASQGEGRGQQYRLETYEKHIELVYQAFRQYWKDAEWAAAQLEQRFGWQKDSVTKAAHLAVLLHDVGKLSKDWQSWVRKYQKALVEAELLDEDHLAQAGKAYAHTDFRSDIPLYKEIQNSIKPPRPWHAVEGALAVMPLVMDALEDNQDLSRAVLSAIARHHAAHSDAYGNFELEADSGRHIQATLPDGFSLNTSKLFGIGKPLPSSAVDTRRYILEPNDEGAYLAYLLLVRALRRADSKGTERGAVSTLYG